MTCPCCNAPKPVLLVPTMIAGRYVLVARKNLVGIPTDAVCVRCYDRPPR